MCFKWLLQLAFFNTCINQFLGHFSGVPEKKTEKKAWFIKRWLLQGIAVALPITITAVILYYSVLYADAVFWFAWDLLPWDLSKPDFPGVGLIVVVSFLILLGFLTESWIINKGLNLFNLIMSKLPFIRNIYSN